MPPETPRTTRLSFSSGGSGLARVGGRGLGCGLLGCQLGRVDVLAGQQVVVDLAERDRERLLLDVGVDEGADLLEQPLAELGVVGIDLPGALGAVEDQLVLAVGLGEQVVDGGVGDTLGIDVGGRHARSLLVSVGASVGVGDARGSRCQEPGPASSSIKDTNSSAAAGTSRLTMLASNSVLAASSSRAVARRRSRSASSSVPRPTSRRTSSSHEGGARKTISASGMAACTWRAPCRSISSIASRPDASASSSGPRGVPYRAALCTTGHSRSSSRSTIRSNSASDTNQ